MHGSAQEIHEFYGQHARHWGKYLGAVTRKLSRRLEQTGIKYVLTQRIKTAESLLEKQARRASKKSGTVDVTRDLLGMRVTVPFLEDVDAVVAVIEGLFQVHEIERKAEQLSYREFAYDSVHVVIVDPEVDVAYPPGCLNASCEIQVRTTLQDAWAEVEHELIYKGSVKFADDSVRKKLAALKASLTLSDIIFQEIRDHQEELRRWGSERFRELERKAAALGAAELSRPLPDSSAVHSSEIGPLLTFLHEDVESVVRLALEAHSAGNYTVAIRRYGEALEIPSDTESRAAIYNYRGLAYFMAGRERAALSDFERSVRCDPLHYPAMNNSALIWRRFGHLDRSLELFDRSLKTAGGQADVHYMRAQTLLGAKLPAEALEAVNEALSIDATYEDAIKLQAKLKRKLADSQ